MAVLSYLFKGHIKTASNGPSYSNAVIGTLAVDGVGRYIWYSEEGTGGRSPPRLFLVVPNVTAHPTTVYQLHII